MKETEAKKMEVLRVNQVRKAEIEKEALIVEAEAKQRNIQIDADAKKYEKQQLAEAVLIEREKEAEGIKLLGKGKAESIKNVGEAEAEAEKLRQLASVTAQTELAKSIGENEAYQSYLVQIETLKINRDVGIEYAKALTQADVKILANSGDVQSGIGGIKDIVSSKGGAGIVGLIEGLKQSESGSELVNGLLDKLKGDKK
jgi:flotillin